MPEFLDGTARNGLCELATEFKELDELRRGKGLSLAEAERYRVLFERLSDALASCHRQRQPDVRQFLRVQADMTLIMKTAQGERRVACPDFGGGGCAIDTAELLALGGDIWLDGAVLDGRRFPLHGRAVVTWARLPAAGSDVHGYGLRFAIDSDEMRDQVDRLFYRVLDLFLQLPMSFASKAARARRAG